VRAGLRAGFTMAEVIVALTIAAIIMTALTSLVVQQGKFYAQQDAMRSARSVSRASINMMLSELRLVEAPGGVVAAAPDSVVVLVPYGLGIVCQADGTGTTLSLLPTDSIAWSDPGFSGYAWRDANGTYTYLEAGSSLSVSGAARCTASNISVLAGGGRAVTLQPPAPLAPVGSTAFLFRRISYRFRASTAMPGRVALWRTVVAAGASEELVAPFDATARFRFYVANRDTAQDDVPSPVTTTRGVEIRLYGQSPATAGNAAAKAPMTTAVFFKNRMD
jgi:prepilin-type N-terminal cleavage/methylation domain-containing protein